MKNKIFDPRSTKKIKWYPGVLEDLKKESNLDKNVTLEDAVHNFELRAKHE